MTQEEFENDLLEFLKDEGGLVFKEQICQWKKKNIEYSDCSLETAFESLLSQEIVEVTDKGARAIDKST